MRFDWDAAKAATNLRKHKVSFAEAASVFADPLAYTFADPDHSTSEERWLTFGRSVTQRLLVVSMPITAIKFVSSVPARRQPMNEKSTKKHKVAEPDTLRSNYERSALGKGVRGKHLAGFQAGTNLVLLAPDVADVFATTEAVNDALRSLIAVAEQSARGGARSTKPR